MFRSARFRTPRLTSLKSLYLQCMHWKETYVPPKCEDKPRYNGHGRLPRDPQWIVFGSHFVSAVGQIQQHHIKSEE